MVIGLIASAALILMNSENFGNTPPDIIKSVILAVAALIFVLFTKIHPILLIIASGIIGYFIFDNDLPTDIRLPVQSGAYVSKSRCGAYKPGLDTTLLLAGTGTIRTKAQGDRTYRRN